MQLPKSGPLGNAAHNSILVSRGRGVLLQLLQPFLEFRRLLTSSHFSLSSCACFFTTSQRSFASCKLHGRRLSGLKVCAFTRFSSE